MKISFHEPSSFLLRLLRHSFGIRNPHGESSCLLWLSGFCSSLSAKVEWKFPQLVTLIMKENSRAADHVFVVITSREQKCETMNCIMHINVRQGSFSFVRFNFAAAACKQRFFREPFLNTFKLIFCQLFECKLLFSRNNETIGNNCLIIRSLQWQTINFQFKTSTEFLFWMKTTKIELSRRKHFLQRECQQNIVVNILIKLKVWFTAISSDDERVLSTWCTGSSHRDKFASTSEFSDSWDKLCTCWVLFESFLKLLEKL